LRLIAQPSDLAPLPSLGTVAVQPTSLKLLMNNYNILAVKYYCEYCCLTSAYRFEKAVSFALPEPNASKKSRQKRIQKTFETPKRRNIGCYISYRNQALIPNGSSWVTCVWKVG
jgi:hypothetical protein